jgi:hypothetical protein
VQVRDPEVVLALLAIADVTDSRGSIALGLALDLLFPGIPVAVCVAATMAGALVAALKAPLFAALFTMVLVQKETAPVIAVAVVASSLAKQEVRG